MRLTPATSVLPRDRARRSRGAALGLIASLALVLIGGAVSSTNAVQAQGSPSGNVGFAVDTKENGAAVSSGVRVWGSERQADSHATVVYSIREPNLDGPLGAGERLHVAGTVFVSRCNQKDLNPGSGPGRGNLRSPCETMPVRSLRTGSYDYAPHLKIRLIRTRHAGDAVPNGKANLLGEREHTCRVHPQHCPMTIDQPHPRLNGKGGHLNLTVEAWTGGDVKPGDRVELEGNCYAQRFKHCKPLPLGDGAEQAAMGTDLNHSGITKGQLSAVWLGAHTPTSSALSTAPSLRRVAIDTGSGDKGFSAPRRVIRSIPIRHLNPGDVVEVDGAARFRNDPGNAPYRFHHHVDTTWILGSSPLDVGVSPGTFERWMAPYDGRGCTEPHGCLLRQVGAVAVPLDLPPDSTMYANFVADVRDDRVTSRKRYLVDVLSGRFGVTCYAASSESQPPCTPGPTS